MIIRVDETGSVDRFKALLDEVSQHDEVRSVLILACDANGVTPDSVDGILASTSVPVFGGIFPEIICEKVKLNRGFIVAGLAERANVQVIPNLSDAEASFDEMIDDRSVTNDTKTMLVFVDGLAKCISSLVDSLFDVFALEFNYLGGGAGSLSFEQKPCLFTNGGLVQDSAILATLTTESGVGVCHGWSEVDGPFLVTESDRNAIQTLDWKPAFQVYREVVEQHSRRTFAIDNFFELAKSYPFGITRLGSERVVRDPLLVRDDGSLVCVGEVPQESYVYILTGDATSLVDAAARALTLSGESFHGHSEKRTTLFIDCISRALFLEGEFIRELEAVQQEGTALIGALTLGEIANSRRDYLEFYNKTSVVGALEA
jgi:hypothetical protein